MLSLTAKIRKTTGKKTETLRKEGILPAVLYGPKIKSQPVEVDAKEFEKVFQEAGESSLLELQVGKDKYLVLIHELKRDPLTGYPLHVDFYQPSLEEKIEAEVPIILEGEAPAVKTLGGTLYKNIGEVRVKALPQNLPKEIRVDISNLNTFEDHIKVKDLKIAEGVEILREQEEIVVSVSPPEKVEEELEKPIEEKVEEVEKVEKEKKEESKEEEGGEGPQKEEPKEEKEEKK